MNLSVIIVNYNVKYYLEQCLNSVLKAIHDIDSEIFVVDNNSSDDSVEMLNKQFPLVKLIQNNTNLGFAKANNQAIAQAKGEYILLLNPDTIIEEDCFVKLLAFMHQSPKAGAVGVKMVNGDGKFLPESKRGFPFPSVAFYKFSGLSKLFPKSRTFAKYHLSFLNKDEIHEVDVLAGAFMFLRKSTLDIVGSLDEDFFMYGEDIDLSYRIQKAGFSNYYYPDTTIIHYKGESTKKNSLNYVYLFYKAMQIFASKHFSKQKAFWFGILINLAIVFSATIALLYRSLKKMALPLVDVICIYLIVFVVQFGWAKFIIYPEGGQFPTLFTTLIIPIYLLLWVGIMHLAGSYDKPYSTKKTIYGLLIGTVIILLIYSLIPESYRYSRAIILISAMLNILIISSMRIVLHKMKFIDLERFSEVRILIIGQRKEFDRLNRFYQQLKKITIVGYIFHEGSQNIEQSYLGKPEDLNDLINLHKIDELIFCAADFSTQEIISLMSFLNLNTLRIRIAPLNSKTIIGSNSITSIEDVFTYELNSINHPTNRRLKRVFDLLVALLLITISPIAIFCINKPLGFIKNIFKVIGARKTWVGYQTSNMKQDLPRIKAAILNPTDLFNNPTIEADKIIESNLQYAKEYHLFTDLSIIYKSFKQLGRQEL